MPARMIFYLRCTYLGSSFSQIKGYFLLNKIVFCRVNKENEESCQAKRFSERLSFASFARVGSDQLL